MENNKNVFKMLEMIRQYAEIVEKLYCEREENFDPRYFTNEMALISTWIERALRGELTEEAIEEKINWLNKEIEKYLND
jgi:hypothetical protein